MNNTLHNRCHLRLLPRGHRPKYVLCYAMLSHFSRVQLCVTPVPGILQARTLEWVSISFSNAWKWKVKTKSLSRVQLLATPWTAAYQALLSMGFSRQEYWSGVPLPSPDIRKGSLAIWELLASGFSECLFVHWLQNIQGGHTFKEEPNHYPWAPYEVHKVSSVL